MSTADLDIRRESLISAGSNVVLVAVHLATLAVLARLLGTGALGTYFYALSASMIAIIPSRELSEIMRKRVSELDTPSDEFFGFAQWGTALYLVVFGATLFLVGPLLARHTPLTSPTILAFGVYTAVLTQSAMSTRLYDAVGHPGASMISQSVRETVFLGGVVGLAALGTVSAASVLLLRAGVHLLVALTVYLIVGIVPRLPSRTVLTSGFEFGKWSFPTGVASHIWGQAPTLLVGALLGGSAVALFETAKRVSMVGAYLATCINDPLLVKASALDSTDEDVLGYVTLALDYTPSVAIPALFIMAPIATDVLLVAAGPEYAAGGLVLVGVAAIHVLSGMISPLSASIRGVDRPRYVFYVTAGTLVVGVPTVVVAAVTAGLEGVVLGLVLLELGGVVASEVAAMITFDVPVLPDTLHVQFAAAVVTGSFVWVASHAVAVGTAHGLLLVIAPAVAIHYGLFALGNRQFRTGVERTVRDVVGTVWRRPSI